MRNKARGWCGREWSLTPTYLGTLNTKPETFSPVLGDAGRNLSSFQSIVFPTLTNFHRLIISYRTPPTPPKKNFFLEAAFLTCPAG